MSDPAAEKKCPLLKQDCLKAQCALWVKEKCALVEIAMVLPQMTAWLAAIAKRPAR
ncbi:MAG: hypothetical protein AB1641_22645 [Thermodesulfobacteriota bacterium]